MKPRTDAPHVHFFLLGVSDTPVGGYKVVYEYANALTALGIPVTLWHSRAFYADVPRARRTLTLAKSRARAILTRVRLGRRLVRWFEIDPRVEVRLCGGYPVPAVRPHDVIVATAVETTPRAVRLARDAGATSAALIQHFETWAAPEDFIRACWASVDERVAIAPWLAELCEQSGLDTHVVPNAIDSRSFPQGPPIADRERSVLTLLSPHGYKRSDVVTAAFSRINAESPDVKLRAFGQEPRPVGLPMYIDYFQAPPPETLARLYRETAIYMCGSDAEGWHLPPAEATMAGAAVVSTDIGGVRVSMQDDALYVPPGEPDLLGLEVLAALRDLRGAQSRVDNAGARLRARTYETNTHELINALGMDGFQSEV